MSTAASFTYEADGLSVWFTNTSTTDNPPMANVVWDFGDGGTDSSGNNNPQYVYNAPGSYTVKLTFDDYASVGNTISQVITIARPDTTTVNLEWIPSAPNSLTGDFHDTTATANPPINRWAWDFGDGSPVSNVRTPTHTYAAAGTYSVKLTITDYAGLHSVTKSQVIGQAAATPTPIANFTYTTQGMVVSFVDSSTDANGTITARQWSFGDGLSSNAANPSHTYVDAGTYAVALTLTDAGGKTSTKTVSIAVGTVTNGSDTYTLKGFVGFGALADNTLKTVSPLGELSVYSQTFAKDRQLFGGSTGGSSPSSMDLTVFTSVSGSDALKDVPTDYASQLLTISAWVYTQALNGQFTADISVFQQALIAQYGSVLDAVTVGTMAVKGSIWMPSSLQFYFTSASTTAPTLTAKSRIKLWFADASFRTEYDEYALVFIPPLTNLDTFFGSSDQIKTALAQLTLPILTNQIQTAAAGDPYTLFSTDAYNWIDPSNSNNFLPTNWTYILYGAAGNNVDVIKQQLAQYILNNSAHPRADWAAIFPDIFSSTEFIITPLWTQIAIPNLTLDPSGVYSPVVNQTQALNLAVETACGMGYTPEFVGNILNIVPTPFKSMCLLAVGGPDNRGGISEFAKRWTDYINVSSTNLDFDRMSQDTQGFVLLLQRMLKTAETMTASTDLPTGMTRLSRKDRIGSEVLFLVANYNSIDYLMVAKSWMVGKYGQTTNTIGSIGLSYDGIFVNGAYQLLNSSSQMTMFFSAQNAKAPLKYEIIDTDITGASIEPTTGMFVGTFPSENAYSLTLKMTDENAYSVQRTFAFNYQHPTASGGGSTPPLALTNVNAPSGTVGVAYSGSIKITGGKSPYSLYGIQTVPAGMAVSVQGDTVILGGTPTVSGSGSFNIAVQDSSGAGGGAALATSSQFSIAIAPAS